MVSAAAVAATIINSTKKIYKIVTEICHRGQRLDNLEYYTLIILLTEQESTCSRQ